MKKTQIAAGVHWIDCPEHDVRVLCGCPADAVKHLMRRGLIGEVEEADGTRYETGPNVLVLSDISLQNGEFTNLAEFPVLQMLYRQGMLVPGHANNTGAKPIIVGSREQVEAQREYIFRGNYGLVSEDEMIAAGVSKALAAEYMHVKTTFAYGRIKPPDELIDFRVLEDEPVELARGVTIERVAVNTFRVRCDDDHADVSLTVDRREPYRPPYILGQHKVKREYFSIVHTGEGDGWDVNRPCMASILVFQGRIYLIDAGPGVMATLNSLGISVNEIAGIFHTHAHDDHFSGLTSLVRADHRLTYFATPLVRASVQKKLAALMSFPEQQFERYFATHDLSIDTWNLIDGLEVKPVYSPHPVETTIMFFRARWQDGYKSYAHFADICALDRLNELVRGTTRAGRALRKSVREHYLTPADVKKLDIGGAAIHGNAEDFRDDASKRIVLSHRSTPLTVAEKEIGTDTSFGMQDVLIRSITAGEEHRIFRLLALNFPAAPTHELAMLVNCGTETYSVGSILLRHHTVSDTIYLLVNGLVEMVESESGVQNILTPGTMIGERTSLFGVESARTYRAFSYVRLLAIPTEMYRTFIERADLWASMREYLDRKYFLEGTYLLGDQVAGMTLNAIAQEMVAMEAATDDTIEAEAAILLIESGRVAIVHGNHTIETAVPGTPLGEQHLIGDRGFTMKYRAVEAVRYYSVPIGLVESMPIVHWKLLELRQLRERRCIVVTQEESE